MKEQANELPQKLTKQTGFQGSFVFVQILPILHVEMIILFRLLT